MSASNGIYSNSAIPMGRPRFLGEVVKSVSGEHSDWHSHDFGQLISSTRGSMYVGTAHRVLLLSPAMAIWIPPDAEHWMRTGLNNEMLYVDVNREEAKQLNSDCHILAMTPLLSALMHATLPTQAAARTSEHTDALHRLLRCELVAGKDVALSVVMPSDKRIRNFAQTALENPAPVESVDSWLINAAASRKTIERLFIAETGMTPARWLRHVRILHAVSQISAGQKISSVAFDMGYDSTSAFSYMFRKTLGVTPRSFLPNTAVLRSTAE
ncbi:AraC family transcriptional regulator [uncultured Roseobacter sp.]|uniref:AraC family transcriptional regulator n=1 Tax=uncultured Roseobacter sp. TaxID=114847 RepID=UPI002606F4B8|nr:AraC family transcriptional regulator [uncultured Roseobacter sp.]